MLIRSQDKNILFDYQNAYIDRVGTCLYFNPYASDLTNNGIVLGCYSTEEKALKVLDGIQKYHDSSMVAYSMDGMIERVTDIPNKTFEMPTDEELDEPTSQTIVDDVNKLYEVTETDKELADALNTVENYKRMLFGK